MSKIANHEQSDASSDSEPQSQQSMSTIASSQSCSSNSHDSHDSEVYVEQALAAKAEASTAPASASATAAAAAACNATTTLVNFCKEGGPGQAPTPSPQPAATPTHTANTRVEHSSSQSEIRCGQVPPKLCTCEEPDPSSDRRARLRLSRATDGSSLSRGQAKPVRSQEAIVTDFVILGVARSAEAPVVALGVASEVEMSVVTLGVARSDLFSQANTLSSTSLSVTSDHIGTATVSMSEEESTPSSCIGGSMDAVPAGLEENNGEHDSDDNDEPPGLRDESSEDEISDGEVGSDEDIDHVTFVGWRMDGWASLQVGRKDRGKLKRRKVRPHDLSELMERRGNWRTGTNRWNRLSAGDKRSVAVGEPNAQQPRREQLEHSSVEAAALYIRNGVNRQVIGAMRSADGREAVIDAPEFESENFKFEDGSVVVPPHSDEPGLGEPLQLGAKSEYKGPSLVPRRKVGTLSPMTFAKKPTISVVKDPSEWVEIEVTVDSGACETVMPPGLRENIEIVRSSCSHGAEYEAASGESIPNVGERRCLLMTLGSNIAKKITFLIADVHKPLLSISRCADMGYHCVMGKEGGYLEDQLSGERIPLQRRDNLYMMKAWVRADQAPDKPNSELPFVRQP